MKQILLSTAMLACMTAGASAQTVPDSLTLDISTSTSSGGTFSGVGSSSEGLIGINGEGAGAVVVSNSGLSISTMPVDYPQAVAGSNVDLEAGAMVGGLIDVTNTRSVDVSGTLMGVGQMAASGSTSTTFDASLLSNATASNDLSLPVDDADNSLDQSYSVSGMAQLDGEAESSAAFLMAGTSADFMGQTGTNVGGSFDAQAGYFQYASLEPVISGDLSDIFDSMPTGTYYSIETQPTDIDLPVFSLGGGSISLTAATSDLFSGGVLGSAETLVTLDGTDVSLVGAALCDAADSVLCDLLP